ncbi:hypothetical protein EBH_0028560 [Eimeria brunetti]|uniref:Uncharacterized protein n=1 Tax=Eimeria brunetti TaxID=51314 RepID=U6LPS2_9EIME|nr:hypothetical protein EBH_0028560 [Eimeria brunetti]
MLQLILGAIEGGDKSPLGGLPLIGGIINKIVDIEDTDSGIPSPSPSDDPALDAEKKEEPPEDVKTYGA